MPKFEICVTEHIQRSVNYTLNITKKEVVDAMELVGDDVKDWTDHVHDYVEQNWNDLCHKAAEGDEMSNDIDSVDVDSVELAE